MDKSRRIRMMWRWSMLTAGLITAYWGVYYLVSGSVPAIDSIELTDSTAINLPLSISRWYDVLIGPALACIVAAVVTSRSVYARKRTHLAGLGLGLLFGIISSPGSGLVVGIIFALAISLLFRIFAGRVAGAFCWTGFALGFGLLSGMGQGMLILLLALPAYAAFRLLGFLFARPLGRTFKNWLFAK